VVWIFRLIGWIGTALGVALGLALALKVDVIVPFIDLDRYGDRRALWRGLPGDRPIPEHHGVATGAGAAAAGARIAVPSCCATEMSIS
jgi:hypothetical protein